MSEKLPLKLTMKEPYSRERLIPVRIRGYIDLLRPFTLIPPFFVSMFIMFSSLIYNGKIALLSNWWGLIVTIAQASLTLAILNAASNALNQATDVESDSISKPYRPIPRGVVKPDEAQSIAYILYFFALLRSLTINIWFGLFVFIIMLFTVTYSLPPRIKRFLFLNQIWIAIPRGALGILASWSVFGSPFQKEPLVIGTIATLFFIGGMTTKDIVDSMADKRTGTHTLVNTFGTKKAALISLPFLFFPFAMIPFLINNGILNTYLLPLTIFTIPSCVVFYLMIKESESKTLENIHAWSLMYVEYLFFAVGFSLLVVFGEMGVIKILF
ncbi:MAG: 4-hydroxybenzoate polyprenyltransferase [Thermoplasmata archaeon]|nr:MAG: 4-hydroxybenzoate polyprenyltransferase [Thermoplasmata archaeon]RLF35106.1 MAG: 4-hydroxybenzoate polyprenyltransferase [Thermoplasmata archaeon]